MMSYFMPLPPPRVDPVPERGRGGGGGGGGVYKEEEGARAYKNINVMSMTTRMLIIGNGQSVHVEI